MTSTDILAQLKEYVLAGNKNPQVLETLIVAYGEAKMDEVPPTQPETPTEN